MPPASGAFAAEVVGTEEPGVVAARRNDDRPFRARVAVPGYQPAEGDRVVVLAGDAAEHYVVGVLRSLRPADVVTTVSDGTSVRRVARDAGELLQVVAQDGRVLFEHDAATGRSTVCAPGELSIAAGAGDLSLRSARKVVVDGAQGVELSSERHVRVEADRVLLGGRLVETTAKVARHAADVIETRAGRLVERARDAYREIEGLSQTKAGRVRLVADKTFRVLGERTVFKARREMKLRGEKIYLD